MEPTIDSNRTFQILDGDKDVLLIEEDSFTVSKLKELIRLELKGKFDGGDNGAIRGSFANISIGSNRLALDHMSWVSIKDGELLKTGSKGWEKGKLRIKCVSKITLSPNYQGINYYSTAVQVDIEFSPDEPPKPESPLDDLRALPEYKQQL
ncbi:MAG: KGK domain-containing protein [Potamolinea sp.]